MHPNFGDYLVEQGVLSSAQLSALHRAQRHLAPTLAELARRHRLLTTRQIADCLDQIELHPQRSLLDAALRADYLVAADADFLRHEQARLTPSLNRLLVETELLSPAQVAALYERFERQGAARPLRLDGPVTADFTAKAVHFHARPIVVQHFAR